MSAEKETRNPEEQEGFLSEEQELKTAIKDQTKEVKWRILITVCIYSGFLCLGMSQSVFGSSFADTEKLLSIDTSYMSAAFTANNVGYLAGSLLLSFIYDRFRPEVQLGLATALVALSTMAAPMYRNLVWFITMMTLQGTGMAYIDSGSQAYCLSVWRDHRLQDSIIQGIFMSWSIGSSLCPFIMRPFLNSADYSSGTENGTTLCNISNIEKLWDLNWNDSVAASDIENSTNEFSSFEGNQVAYGYLTIGLLIVPVSISYFIIYFASNSPIRKKSVICAKAKNTQYKEMRKVLLLGQMTFLFLVYVGLEVSFGGLISLYVIRTFCFSSQKGAMMASVFWGSTGIGRLLGVPISMFLQPVHMLCANVLLILVSLLLMLALGETSTGILWGSVISSGIGMSTVYPSAYLWCSRYINITGVATAIFNVGGSVGSMILPLITGILIDIVCPRSFIYTMLALGTSLTLLYILIFSYIKFCMSEIPSRNDEQSSRT